MAADSGDSSVRPLTAAEHIGVLALALEMARELVLLCDNRSHVRQVELLEQAFREHGMEPPEAWPETASNGRSGSDG